MFSAVKVLDPLDDQGEYSENRDRQRDEDHVGHVGLLYDSRDGAVCRPLGRWNLGSVSFSLTYTLL